MGDNFNHPEHQGNREPYPPDTEPVEPVATRQFGINLLRRVPKWAAIPAALALVGGGAVAALASGGDSSESGTQTGDPTEETVGNTTTTDDVLEPTTTTTANNEADDVCFSASEIGGLLFGGQLSEGRMLTTEERVSDPRLDVGSAYPVCSYEFVRRFQGSHNGQPFDGSENVRLEYLRSEPRFDATAEELVSDEFSRLSSNFEDVLLLDYGDSTNFVHADGDEHTYYYVEGDELCLGYAATDSVWGNATAQRLAADVACKLDVDFIPEPETASTPATTEPGPEPELTDTRTLPDGSTISEVNGSTYRSAPNGDLFLVNKDGTEELIGAGGM